MSERPLHITYLVAEAVHPWGGVQTVFREADALTGRGHRVRILCQTGTPPWHEPLSEVIQVPDLDPHRIPDSDLVVGTWFPTVPAAWRCGRGRPVHYCQGYEGDNPGHASQLWLIERVYRLPGMTHLAIAPFLAARLRERYDIAPIVVPYGIREELFTPGPVPPPRSPVRVGLIGPWDVAWKDIPTGVRAARLAQDAGLDLVLVRVSPYPMSEEERAATQGLTVEWNENVRLEEMPAIYRSLDVFLGTSNGGAEGFFLPAVEAMACGVPCILSDIACFRDYAPAADYAVFFPPGDPPALARSLTALAGSGERRSALRDRGLETAAKHGFLAHVDGVEAAFQGLVPAAAAIAEGAEVRVEPTLERQRDLLLFDMLETIAATIAQGDHAEARRMARGATELFPDSAEAWQLRARLELFGQDVAAATYAVVEACRLDPRSPSAAELRAHVAFARGDVEAAVADLAAAVHLGMPGPVVLLDLAKCLLALGRVEEAEPVLEKVVSLQPQDPEVARLRQKLEERPLRAGEPA